MPTIVVDPKKGLHQKAATSALIAGTLSGHRPVVKTITASTSLVEADSGKLFLLDSASESADVTITLPELSSALIGVTYEFAVFDGSNGAGDPGGFLIKTGDLTDTTGDSFAGGVFLVAAQVSSTTNGANGRWVATAANDSIFALDENDANGGGSVGTHVRCTAISATQWFVTGYVVTADADSTGADIFTNGS